MRVPTVTGTSKAIAALAGALAAAGGLAAPSTVANRPSAAASTRTVEVADNRYSPKRLTVAKGTRIKWVWSRDGNGRHDVYLNQRPDGAPRLHSPLAMAPFSFERKLRRPGVYKILCTVHERMRMRIDVSR